MWDIPKLYVSACFNSVQLVPLHPIIMSILFHHYKEDMKRMLAISSDPNNKNAVAAQHLASEIRCIVLKTYVESPLSLIKTKGLPDNQLNDESKRKTLRIVPIKDPQTQMVIGHRPSQVGEESEEEEEDIQYYDELDGDDDEELEEEGEEQERQ